MPDAANNEQNRQMADVVARAAVLEVMREHPEFGEAKIPAPLKWAAGIIGALVTAGISGMAFWLVASVSQMQITLVRMDERSANMTARQDEIMANIDSRVSKLESMQTP